MSNYYTILTNLGAALHANAQVMQTTVPWTHMCLGDGAGAPVVPVQTQTALKREVHRLPITDIAQHPDNPNWLIVEAVVPSDVGGWTVRETAIYGGANGAQCIAVGNYPETYKPVLAEGAAREMVMRMVVEISSTATVKLTIDPAVAIASRAWVESLLASPQKRGLVKLATVDESKEGVRPDVAVTPEGLGAALAEVGGLPRFTPYIWGGRAGAMPQGDTQSSGQQLTDLMYPTMRAEVAATQFTCTETEWQADPYKRVTHWSLGDGAAWMRPPDKNGVQPGNVGAFYGVGANPAGAKPGTAVIDAMRNIVGRINANPDSAYQFLGDGPFGTSGALEVEYRNSSGVTDAAAHLYMGSALKFDASKSLPAGTTTDPVTGEFRPRTWYGIWMIRMYGRVTNAGDLDAPALNARMDLLAAGLATLDSKLDSVILYPNGTAAAPANAVAQARYVIPNPFPGFHVICHAEIKIGNNWGGTSWHYDGTNQNSYGVHAEVFGAAAESIVVQVGKYVLGGSINGGDSFGNSSQVSTAPFRLVVKKMKGAM